MRRVYPCVLTGLLLLSLISTALAADGDGALDGPTGQDQALDDKDEDQLDNDQMYDLCVSGCEGTRQMDYWDCYNEYLACVEFRDQCYQGTEKSPGSFHCPIQKNSIKCEMDHFQCQLNAEAKYNACEAGCATLYP